MRCVCTSSVCGQAGVSLTSHSLCERDILYTALDATVAQSGERHQDSSTKITHRHRRTRVPAQFLYRLYFMDSGLAHTPHTRGHGRRASALSLQVTQVKYSLTEQTVHARIYFTKTLSLQAKKKLRVVYYGSTAVVPACGAMGWCAIHVRSKHHERFAAAKGAPR